MDHLIEQLRSSSNTALQQEVAEAIAIHETSFFRDMHPLSKRFEKACFRTSSRSKRLGTGHLDVVRSVLLRARTVCHSLDDPAPALSGHFQLAREIYRDGHLE